MTVALEGGEWSAAHPGRTLPPRKTRYPFYRRLGGPQGRSGRAEYLVLTGIRSQTVQPIVSHFTNWATRPTTKELQMDQFQARAIDFSLLLIQTLSGAHTAFYSVGLGGSFQAWAQVLPSTFICSQIKHNWSYTSSLYVLHALHRDNFTVCKLQWTPCTLVPVLQHETYVTLKISMWNWMGPRQPQLLSCWPFTTVVWVKSQAWPCWICGGWCDTGTGF